MGEVRAVPDDVQDPKLGVQRQRSGVAFPYYTLGQSVEVVEKIYHQAGGACDLSQLAALLDYSGIRNGGFRSRVAATKMFGLVEQEGDRLRVTERGRRIVAPVTTSDKAPALVEAFLAVELFRKVYEEYKGTTLPPEVGLRNLLKDTFQVVPDRVAPTVRIMLDSAEEAGLFTASGRGRMILPLTGGQRHQEEARREPPPPPAPRQHEGHPAPARRDGGGGGGGNPPPDIHPAILGLLQELPRAGTPLSSKRRSALIEAFKATVGFVYPDDEVVTS